MADESLYKVTYQSGRVAVCNRRSLAGKIGLHNDGKRREARASGRSYPRHTIIKIERAPVAGWQVVTSEFGSLIP